MKTQSLTREKISNVLVTTGMVILVSGIGFGGFIGIGFSTLAAAMCIAAIFTDRDEIVDEIPRSAS